MDSMLSFLLAAPLGYILYRLKIPGGLMVGAIIGSAIGTISFDLGTYPYAIKWIAQVIAGSFIASGMQKDHLKHLHRLFKPLLLLCVILLIINLSAGLIILSISPLDAITSFMSTVPGGMSDVPLIASELGANLAAVSTLQFVRLVAGVSIFPSLILYTTKSDTTSFKRSLMKQPSVHIGNTAITLVCGFLSGTIGSFVPMPASALVFSMLGVLVLKITTGLGSLPIWARRTAQLLSGAYIGSGIHHADIILLKQLLLPSLVILIIYTLNCFATGTLLQRLFNFDKRVAMLAATPAGASDMALIAADIGVESPNLIILQVLRMIIVITAFPLIIVLFISVTGL